MVKETPEKEKYLNLQEALEKGDEEADDALLVAELLDDEGKLKVDLSLPEVYELDIMAQQLLGHITSYKQNKEAWRAARNSSDRAKAQQIFTQMRFNELTAAIIQRAYPKAKALADELALINARTTQANRKVQLEKEG